MVVYTRSFDFFYVLICCFTSTVSSWCHVGTVTYLTTLFLGKSPVGSLIMYSVHSFGQQQTACFSKISVRGKNPRKTNARFYLWTVCIQSGHATSRNTAPGVWIPKMCGWEGAIDGIHKSSDILLKNDLNYKYDFLFGKRQLENYF